MIVFDGTERTYCSFSYFQWFGSSSMKVFFYEGCLDWLKIKQAQICAEVCEGGLLNSRGLCGLILALLGLSQVGCVCLVMSWSVLVSFGLSGRYLSAKQSCVWVEKTRGRSRRVLSTQTQRCFAERYLRRVLIWVAKSGGGTLMIQTCPWQESKV